MSEKKIYQRIAPKVVQTTSKDIVESPTYYLITGNIISSGIMPVQPLPVQTVIPTWEVDNLSPVKTGEPEEIQRTEQTNIVDSYLESIKPSEDVPVNMHEKRLYLSDLIQPISNRLMTVNPLHLHISPEDNISADISAEGTLTEPDKIMDESLTEDENHVVNVQKNNACVTEDIKKTDKIHFPTFVSIADREIPPRAISVLPLALQYRKGTITPRRRLPMYTRFGPVQGVLKQMFPEEVHNIVKESDANNKPVYLISNTNDGSFINIDVTDLDKANWFALLRVGKNANIWLRQENSHLFAVTVSPVQAREPLVLGYSKEYADRLKIADDQPILDLDEEIRQAPATAKFSCEKCSQSMNSLQEFERHNLAFHEEGRKRFSSSSKFCCRYCYKKFSKLFSLKRHIKFTCRRKTDSSRTQTTSHKVANENHDNTESIQSLEHTNGQEDILENPNLTQDAMSLQNNQLTTDTDLLALENQVLTTQNPQLDEQSDLLNDFHNQNFDLEIEIEESRLPSDESLQNYTNILDFSTNLFDTDRMPFDISGSSKSENDISKDESQITKGLVPETLNDTPSPSKDNKRTRKLLSPVNCVYCDKKVPKNRLRQHSWICEARRFNCFCGRVFRTKYSLEKHAYTLHRHTNKQSPGKSNKPEETAQSEGDMSSYTCTQCRSVFKRRGMLVNHMTRRHNAPTASSVPLLVKDRRYPCPVCPKLYNTEAKRQIHVVKHHPGTQYNRSQSIVGGSLKKQPSICMYCPRQYATRAKMLQHTRSKHPEMAPPVRDSSKKNAFA